MQYRDGDQSNMKFRNESPENKEKILRKRSIDPHPAAKSETLVDFVGNKEKTSRQSNSKARSTFSWVDTASRGISDKGTTPSTKVPSS